MTLGQFEALARARRATRDFGPDPVPGELLDRLLAAARWAPSGYNLQPWRFAVVADEERKRRLWRACMKQRQVLDAPAVVVFLGDRDAARANHERSLAADLEAGAITPEYADQLRAYVRLAFATGPLGLGWLWKACLVPVYRLFRPAPEIPAVHRRAWVVKQVMLAAMNFMLAAQAASLATVPMEGFDGRRVRRALGLPRRYVVAVVVPVGYAAATDLKKTRLPLEASLV